MVALLRPQPETVVAPRQLRLVAEDGHLLGDAFVAPGVGARRDDERSGASSMAAFGLGHVLMVAVAAVVIFGGLALLRASQGGPVSDSWAGVNAVDVNGGVVANGSAAGSAGASVVAGPGDQVVIAAPGDSLWSIAETVAPGADPRPVVAALIEANGTDSLQIGQQIIIPEQLLD